MSLIPAFEIGVWNLWILQLFVLLTPYILYLFLSKEGRKRNGRTTKAFPMPKKTVKVLAWSTHLVIAPIVIIYSIFLPLKLGTPWLYMGIFIVTLGLTMQCMTTISVANTPLDKPITKGPYSISRHPFYFTGFLTMFGMGIASASWVVLMCAFLWIAFFHIVVPTEERFLLETYGDSYRIYMDRTPRWIGIPKS